MKNTADNTVAANSSAQGFQNNFTGSSGNIHISWLGKLDLADGALQNSTYVAEFAEGATGFGTNLTEPNLDGWPDPNAGWPTLNTTRLAKNNLKVSHDGSVCVLGVGRRTMTTANGFQKMPKPNGAAKSAWNSFVRAYAPDFSRPNYSSLLVGQWDTLTGAGGDNTELFGIWKTEAGLVAVGRQKATNGTADGNAIPTAAIPTWGRATAENESAIFAFLRAENLVDSSDGPSGGGPSATVDFSKKASGLAVFPNPFSPVKNIH